MIQSDSTPAASNELPMGPKVTIRVLLLVGTLTSSASTAQIIGQIESMKLLTSNVGWVSTNKYLFWTVDAGKHFKDVTPKSGHKRQIVSSVFFRDESIGWVLLKCADDQDALADDVCFEFASTTNAGGSWSLVHPKIVDPGRDQSNIEDGVGTYSGTTFLDFADAHHGWAILKKSYNTSRSVGEMLRTVDGGKTWKQLSGNTPPIAEPFRFISPSTGWIAGGPDLELYVTRDAGDSWRKVSLPAPPGVSNDFWVVSNLPVFEGERRGFLWTQYPTGPPSDPNQSILVLFATDDGGSTWKQGRKTSAVPTVNDVEITHSIVIALHSELEETKREGQCSNRRIVVSLFRIGPDRISSSKKATIPLSDGAVLRASFISPEQGG